MATLLNESMSAAAPFSSGSAAPTARSSDNVASWIRHSGGVETLRAQPAGIAVSAGAAVDVGAVTGHGLREVHAQLEAARDDVALGHVQQRCAHADGGAFYPGLGGEVGQALECVDEFGPAIGVAGIVDRV